MVYAVGRKKEVEVGGACLGKVHEFVKATRDRQFRY